MLLQKNSVTKLFEDGKILPQTIFTHKSIYYKWNFYTVIWIQKYNWCNKKNNQIMIYFEICKLKKEKSMAWFFNHFIN